MYLGSTFLVNVNQPGIYAAKRKQLSIQKMSSGFGSLRHIEEEVELTLFNKNGTSNVQG